LYIPKANILQIPIFDSPLFTSACAPGRRAHKR